MSCEQNPLNLTDNNYIRYPSRIKNGIISDANLILGLGTYINALSSASLNLPTNTRDYIISNVLIEETNTIIQNARPTTQGAEYVRHYDVEDQTFTNWVSSNNSASRTYENVFFTNSLVKTITTNETNFYNANSTSILKLDITANSLTQQGDRITIINNGIEPLEFSITNKKMINVNPVFATITEGNYFQIGEGKNVVLVFDSVADRYLITINN